MGQDDSVSLEQAEAVAARERELLADRLALELLRPVREYSWPIRSEWPAPVPPPEICEAPAATQRPVSPLHTRAERRSRALHPSAAARPKAAPFTVLRPLEAASMPFERVPVSSEDAARARAAEAL